MKKVLGIISLLLSTTLATANSIDFDKAFKESAKIEKQIKKTSFPKQTYLITDFGAKPDTPDAPCHEAINQAIVTCCLNGGGTVVVPKGTFYTGPITLKSNVNFHVEEGAVLRFSADQSLYFPGVITRWEGIDCYNAHPLIYAYGETNIAITGKGTIDGQGKVIGDAAADYREPGTPANQGRILKGNEYLTVFNGRTGAAMQTIDYVPARGNLADWGDNRANRSDRFLAAVA